MDIPTKLYRYRSTKTKHFWDELEQSILNRSFFLSATNNLNDPFDFAPAYDETPLSEVDTFLKDFLKGAPPITRERYGEIIRPLGNKEWASIEHQMETPYRHAKLYIEFARETFKNSRKKARVACFSETAHNIPMWAHYANEHTGVCVEFGLKFPQTIANDILFPLNVRYVEGRTVLSTLDLITFSNPTVLTPDHDRKMMDAMNLEKATDWSYEKEWRLFEVSDKPPRYMRCDHLSPIRVIFGLNADPAEIKKCKDLYSDKIQVARAIAATNSYRLIFEEL